jgi:RNA polymerase sigma-70 factor (ECF subfamily)
MPMTSKDKTCFRQMDDRALLDAVLEREELAWHELVRRFRGLIYHCIGVAVKRGEGTLPVEEYDEIFCEVCVNLLRNEMNKLRRYDPERGTKLGTWIGLIAIRTCYDHLRAAARRPSLEGSDPPVDQEDERPSPLDELLDKERHEQLATLVTDLTPRERFFFDLYYRRGMEPSDVAREMNVSIGTVYAKKNKLRSRLLALAVEADIQSNYDLAA